jgi:hypothetical protein
VPLTYWWCYQSDRPTDQGQRQRFDIDRHRNPELLACFVEANQRLQAKLDARQFPSSTRDPRCARERRVATCEKTCDNSRLTPDKKGTGQPSLAIIRVSTG